MEQPGLSGGAAWAIAARVRGGQSVHRAAAGLADRDLADACQRMSAQVATGQSLASCFDRGGPVPASLGPLVDWGTRTGTLPAVLRSASEMFVARSQAQAAFVRTVLPPS